MSFQINLRRVICGVVAATLLVSTVADVQAQNRRPAQPRIGSLAEMGCRKVQGNGSYQATNRDVVIGLQIFRAIATMGDGHTWLHKERPLQVVCRLAAPNQAPRFRTLSLAFGFSDESSLANGAVARLSIYKDGNFYESQTVAHGDKLRWPNIDIRNTRTLALEAECIGTRNSSVTCPNLYFFEDILE